jgi:hypothetical protein
VVLVGSDRLELEYAPGDADLAQHQAGKYRVRLHESRWRNRHAPQLAVSRKQLMVALRRVQAVYIRATFQ